MPKGAAAYNVGCKKRAPKEEIFLSPENETLKTAFSHRCLTLITTSFVLFEIVFLELYADNFWFAFDIAWLGVPVILIVAIFAHFLLSWLSSPRACRLLSFLFKGRLPVVYSSWLKLNSSGVTFGLKHICYQAIDELNLTWLGNLEFRSRRLCGQESPEPDCVLKVPFGVACQEVQNLLLERIKANKGDLSLNERLEKRLRSPIVRGQALVQLFGAVFMVLVLIDVAQSSFYFLETLKQYHLAHVEARLGKRHSALAHLKNADSLYLKPFAVSWVISGLLFQGSSGAGVLQTRAQALFHLGLQKEALSEARKAVDLDPGFRNHLSLARLFAGSRQTLSARAEIADAIASHADSLLPRLYMLAMMKPDAARLELYKKYMDELKESTFEQEPMWPPGGNRFLAENFYSDDISFIFDRLLSPTNVSGKNLPANGPVGVKQLLR